MATFNSIKTKVVAIVSADMDLDESGQVFQYEPEIGEAEKDPFAVVIASGNENDFASTSENKRTYGFTIRIYMERKQRGQSDAETRLEAIVDRLLNAFDEDYTLGGAALISRAAPSRWGYILGDKEYRTAEIVVRAQAWEDITAS